MKLKKLKSIGHNAAHSYFSTMSHIGQQYTCTVLHRFALHNDLSQLELDVLKAEMHPLRSTEVEASLSNFRQQFFDLLQHEDISVEAVKSYKLVVERLGDRVDVIDICCRPELVDMNDKVHVCAGVWQKYPESV
ncbi:hypothetical protein F0P96_06395 [Hymenobacter busanensis]|uniref:Uncharacterized protein n=1 Tax=Hymenobacter busanensis TaxID=2607656 RepID=A0A7L5A011_9BACT|nr:hypothetical protein [Hymenobacter busanensis]KAA9338459.1 hypothetical protein F0P96_06395 [Hymenobacter busanensis]QHJ09114.1 hypothetical protein GUY19_18210 [Hymenobacter busanensis]